MNRRIEFIKINCSSLIAFTGIFASFYPTLSLYADQMGASKTEIGLLYGIYTVCGVFVKFTAGFLSYHLGIRFLLVVSSLFMTEAPVILIFADSIYILYLGSLFYGFSAFYMTCATSYVFGLYEKDNFTRAFGTYTFIAGIGCVIGPLIAGNLIEYSGSKFKYVYVFSTLMAVIAFAIILTLKGKTLGMLEGGDLLKRPKLSKEVFLIAISRLLNSFPLGFIHAFFPLLAKSGNFNEAMIGLLFSVKEISVMLMRKFTSVVSVKSNRLLFIFIGTVIYGVSVACCVFVLPNLALLLIVLFMMGVAESLCVISTLGYLGDRTTSFTFPIAIGLVGTMHDVGRSCGAILPGFSSDAIGLIPTFYICAIVTLLLALVIRYIFKTR
ncbi:MAG: MFS transporter [Planctomycetes bacterium]|nr:MFS transporter [Planctomycetota bacterium]